MICPDCKCYALDYRPHEGNDDCLEALKDWKKEADARLIQYEEQSAAREAEIKTLSTQVNIKYGKANEQIENLLKTLKSIDMDFNTYGSGTCNGVCAGCSNIFEITRGGIEHSAEWHKTNCPVMALLLKKS